MQRHELARTRGAEQHGGARARVGIAQPVEADLAPSGERVFVGQAVDRRAIGDRAMEAGVEHGDVRRVRNAAPQRVERVEYRARVQRRKLGRLGDRRARRIVEEHRIGGGQLVDAHDPVGNRVDPRDVDRRERRRRVDRSDVGLGLDLGFGRVAELGARADAHHAELRRARPEVHAEDARARGRERLGRPLHGAYRLRRW
jgi:hypothetical protein